LGILKRYYQWSDEKAWGETMGSKGFGEKKSYLLYGVPKVFRCGI
jgi:hypothetical protein